MNIKFKKYLTLYDTKGTMVLIKRLYFIDRIGRNVICYLSS